MLLSFIAELIFGIVIEIWSHLPSDNEHPLTKGLVYMSILCFGLGIIIGIFIQLSVAVPFLLLGITLPFVSLIIHYTFIDWNFGGLAIGVFVLLFIVLFIVL